MNSSQQLILSNSAVRSAQEVMSEGVTKVLTFVADGEVYAVSIDAVKEILEYGSVTRIPMTPPHIRGVLNLRGRVVPVIDLSVRLDGQPSRVTKRTCIIVLAVEMEDEVMDVGVVVDAVNEVLDIAETDLEQAPSFGVHIRADFIQSMARVRGRFITILAPSSTFSIEELAELIGTGSAAGIPA